MVSVRSIPPLALAHPPVPVATPPAGPSAGQAASPANRIRPSVRLPAWLEVAKPRLIPLLLATTIGGMALTAGWPLDSWRLLTRLLRSA